MVPANIEHIHLSVHHLLFSYPVIEGKLNALAVETKIASHIHQPAHQSH